MMKYRWFFILLGLLDLALIIMHFTGYFFLFLKPTGYVIPLAINSVVLILIGFQSPIKSKSLIVGGFSLLPLILIHGFFIWVAEYNYTKIDSPHTKQSLVIEYKHITLGETTYSYHFYKTRFGFIGKLLADQSISIMIRGTEHPEGYSAREVLGLNNAVWVTEKIVRFPTWKGNIDVFLTSSSLSDTMVTDEQIQDFIKKLEENASGEILNINGNRLETRYDELTKEKWIDVINEGNAGAIPQQQCSRIVRNEERGYYMLEECTHKWEYEIYPIMDR